MDLPDAGSVQQFIETAVKDHPPQIGEQQFAHFSQTIVPDAAPAVTITLPKKIAGDKGIKKES